MSFDINAATISSYVEEPKSEELIFLSCNHCYAVFLKRKAMLNQFMKGRSPLHVIVVMLAFLKRDLNRHIESVHEGKKEVI